MYTHTRIIIIVFVFPVYFISSFLVSCNKQLITSLFLLFLSFFVKKVEKFVILLKLVAEKFGCCWFLYYLCIRFRLLAGAFAC